MAYWNLLAGGTAALEKSRWTSDPDLAHYMARTQRARNQALSTEIENQMKALERARKEMEGLKMLVARPGLPVVYDTNMLNHWQQPGDILWRDVFKAQDEKISLTRLVIPLRVIE
ncbi:hypothetical protein [Streptomyces sp. NPDC023838]|uniref:hypothetical protein n=1 Tax=Streptomyces sp. NPDC023838 TaxID=3154325 RepID=UPI0033C4828D